VVLTFDAVETELLRVDGGTASHARGTWSERTSVRVRLRSASGAWGEGEAAPLPGFSRETVSDVIEAARRLDVARLRPAVAPEVDASLPSLRFALEMAMLDVRRQVEQRSLVALLGGDPRRRVPVNGLVDRLGEPGERLAGSWLRRGVRTLKVKVGRPDREGDEVELLDRLFDRTSARLRLDANGRLGHRLAAWILRHGRSTRLEYVEDPGSGPALDPGPWALDEALRRDPDRDLGDVRAVVLKPTLWGGLAPLFRTVARARSAGVAVVVTHALEPGPAYDAAVAIGIAAGTPGFAQGLAPHPFLRPGPRPHRMLQGWLRWKDVAR